MSHTNTVAYIYNPDQQGEQELIDSFVIRKNEFEKLFVALKTASMEKPEQHFIIQGVRGSGKTTLLLRLLYAVQKDKELQKRAVAIRFPEEQYYIRTLAGVWEAVLELLAYDPKYPEFTGAHEQMIRHSHEEEYDEQAFDIFSSILGQRGKKAILFIDNFGELLDKFTEKEHRRLREILLTSSDIRIVAGSAVTMEHTYRYDKPFFDFFRIIQLKGLDMNDTLALLRKLAKNRHDEHVRYILDHQPEKVETLRRLTGGIPRTIVLLFEVFADERDGDSMQNLELLLDRVTPLYKHRMDDLSTQQQAIVDAVARAWDAVAVKDIAEQIRMESKAVSAQLRQLEKDGIIEKEATSTKNHLYRIQERFFNIWYLMRNSRRGEKEKVVWLVRFLESWCDRNELIQRADTLLQCFSKPDFNQKYARFMGVSLLETRELPPEWKDQLHKKLYGTGIGGDTKKVEQEEVDALITKAEAGESWAMTELGSFYNKHGDEVLAEQWWLKAVDKGEAWAMIYLGDLYQERGDEVLAEQWWLKATEAGNSWAMIYLGRLYKRRDDEALAEQWWLKAAEAGNSWAMIYLGRLYNGRGNEVLAEQWWLKAAEQGEDWAMIYLGRLYKRRDDEALAEQWWLKADKTDKPWANILLANLYHERGEFEKAEECCVQVIENSRIEVTLELIIFSWQYMSLESSAARIEQKLLERAEQEPLFFLPLALFALQQNNVEEAVSYSSSFFTIATAEQLSQFLWPVQILFTDLIARNMNNSALFLLQKHDLKDKLKPMYYVLMYYMQDEYPDEYKKMGDELKQTVEEMIEEVKNRRMKYIADDNERKNGTKNTDNNGKE